MEFLSTPVKEILSADVNGDNTNDVENTIGVEYLITPDISSVEITDSVSPACLETKTPLSLHTTPKQKVPNNGEESAETPEDCPICLCSLNLDDDLNDSVVVTSCNHKFHKSCLHRVKTTCNLACPVCRGKLSPPSRVVLSSNNSSSNVIEYQYQYAVPYQYTNQASRNAIVNAAQRGRNAVRYYEFNNASLFVLTCEFHF